MHFPTKARQTPAQFEPEASCFLPKAGVLLFWLLVSIEAEFHHSGKVLSFLSPKVLVFLLHYSPFAGRDIHTYTYGNDGHSQNYVQTACNGCTPTYRVRLTK